MAGLCLSPRWKLNAFFGATLISSGIHNLNVCNCMAPANYKGMLKTLWLSLCDLSGRELWHNTSCSLRLWGTTSLTFRQGMWEYWVFPKAISLLSLSMRNAAGGRRWGLNKPEQGGWVLRSQDGLGLGQRMSWARRWVRSRTQVRWQN